LILILEKNLAIGFKFVQVLAISPLELLGRLHHGKTAAISLEDMGASVDSTWAAKEHQIGSAAGQGRKVQRICLKLSFKGENSR